MEREDASDAPAVDASTAEAVAAAVYQNSFRSYRGSIGSVGLRPHPLRFEELHSQECNRVAEDFLVDSRLRRGDVEFGLSVTEYFNDSAEVISSLNDQGRPGTRSVPLPDPVALRLPFDETVRRRRSVRSYTGDPIPVTYLAALLGLANGLTGQLSSSRLGLPIHVRAVPSAGALFPVQIVVAALRVDGLDVGLYQYDPTSNRLWLRGDESDVSRLMECFVTPNDVIATGNAALALLLVARPWRSLRKYGSRGMRNVFLEAGAIAEHVNLAVTALGLGSVDCSSIYDDEAHDVLNADGVFEALVHCVVVGVPA